MRSMLFAPLVALLLLALPLAAGCGDDKTSCSGINTQICEKACACGADCALGSPSAWIGFDSASDCKGFLNLGCSGGGGYQTPEDCASALTTAQCADFGDGTNGLVVPEPACDPID